MDLISSVFECQDEFASLGCDTKKVEGCTVITSQRCPDLYEFNHVRNIDFSGCAESQTIKRVEEVERIFRENGRQYCRFHTDYRTSAPGVERVLRDKGYHPVPILTQMFNMKSASNVVQTADVGEDVDIFEVDFNFDDEDRCLNEIWNYVLRQEYMNAVGYIDVGNLIDFKAYRIVKANSGLENRGKYRSYMAASNGRVAGHVELFCSKDVMYLADLYIIPEFRMKKIASRLIDQVINTASESRCKAVYLNTYSFDTPRYMYIKHGFSDLTESISWIKGKEAEEDSVDML